ncbi:MAG TPA: hypothetical protein QGG47_09235 [Acidobacteriota bacterium]|nr:hypothetical protein [Acidobacteriota bacterium]
MEIKTSVGGKVGALVSSWLHPTAAIHNVADTAATVRESVRPIVSPEAPATRIAAGLIRL